MDLALIEKEALHTLDEAEDLFEKDHDKAWLLLGAFQRLLGIYLHSVATLIEQDLAHVEDGLDVWSAELEFLGQRMSLIEDQATCAEFAFSFASFMLATRAMLDGEEIPPIDHSEFDFTKAEVVEYKIKRSKALWGFMVLYGIFTIYMLFF